MVHVRKGLFAGAAAWVVVLSLVCQSALGRDVKLAICPQKMPAAVSKYSLLPPQASLTEGDAVPLYEKAVRVLPDKARDDQIRQWLKMPIDQLPADQVEEALKPYLESFKCAAQAVKCRECKWPAWKPGTPVANVDEYHQLAQGIRLWARLELANGAYDGAMLAMQTGFGMARQLGQALTLIQLQVGAATAGGLCREIGELAQMASSPNLYLALAGLPKPLVDAEKAIESERKVALSEFSGKLLSSKQLEKQMKPMHDRTRAIAKRLDSDLAILQCVEAIRAYAASHGGQLPPTLADIKDISIPKDPMCGEAFRYTRSGSTAVLASTAPAGSEKADEVHYEIVVKN